MWDKQIAIDQVKAITLKGKIFFGVGAINAFENIAEELKNEGISTFLIVTGKNAYISSGAWEVIESVRRRYAQSHRGTGGHRRCYGPFHRSSGGHRYRRRQCH